MLLCVEAWSLVMSLNLYLAYVIACLVIALLPGPTITLIIATSIRHGTVPALPTSSAPRSAWP